MAKLLLSTLESVPGYSIQKHLGLVQGSSVRAKHFGRDIMAGFKNMVGGELKGYTELLQETRDEAIGRTIRELGRSGVPLYLACTPAGRCEILGELLTEASLNAHLRRIAAR